MSSSTRQPADPLLGQKGETFTFSSFQHRSQTRRRFPETNILKRYFFDVTLVNPINVSRDFLL